jgi:hypothetical protein
VRPTGPLIAAGVVAILLGGCGGSGRHASTRPASSTSPSASTTTSVTTRSSAARPVADRRRHGSGGGYGKTPSWLPSAAPPRQRALQSSFSQPVLTIQGDALSISLSGARLLVTAVGPSVPEIGRTPVPATSPVTFIVTFTQVTAPVSLRRSAWVLVDENHQIHHPRVTAIHGGPPPTQIRPGQTVSIKLHSVLPTGDGGLEWRPDGQRVIAGWDFNVEID